MLEKVNKEIEHPQSIIRLRDKAYIAKKTKFTKESERLSKVAK